MLAATPNPEPLPVDFRNEAPAAATVFVRALIDVCERRGAPLARIGICPVLGAGLLRELEGAGYQGVTIAADDALMDCIEIIRFSDSPECG